MPTVCRQRVDYSLQAFKRYLSGVKSQSTVKVYLYGARYFVRYVRQERVNVRITPGVLSGFSSWLHGEIGLTPASIRVMVPAARKYLEWRRGLGDQLPVFSRVDYPKRNEPLPMVLRAKSLAVFHEVVGTMPEPVRTALLLLPLCGLRGDEFTKLRLSQVEVDDLDGTRFVFARLTGKSKADRMVPLSDPGSDLLHEYLSGYRARIERSPWLFPSRMNEFKPLSPRTLRRSLREVKKRIGIENLGPHTLRKTWATMLLEQDVPITTVAQLAGHKSIQTTFKHYTAARTPVALAEAVRDTQFYDDD